MDQFGYVKVSRKMFAGDPFWDEERQYSRAEAWIDLIQMASWKDRKQVVGATVVHLERGELLASERFLSERWQWSRGKVRRFLDLLEKMDRISKKTDHKTDHHGTVVSVCNYDAYQSSDTTDGPPTGRERTTNGPPADQREGSKERKASITGSSEPEGEPSPVEDRSKAEFCREAAPILKQIWWQGDTPPPGTDDSRPWNLGRELNLAWTWVTEGTASADDVLAFLRHGRAVLRMQGGPSSLKWLNARRHRHRLYEAIGEARKREQSSRAAAAGPTSLSDLLSVVEAKNAA